MNTELSSPRWHLYDFNSVQQQATLLQLDEADYRAASFLDQRAETPARQRRVVPFRDFLDAVPAEPRPAHCIFHLGHCGSTLLSRALAATPEVLPLREPLTLRRLAAESVPLPEALQWLPLVLAAHTRVFHPAQVAMIKASSTCNRLVEPVLHIHPMSRAILLYVPLETYLAGMLGKRTSPTDLHAQSESRLADWRAIPGALAPGTAPLTVTDLDTTQLAVMSWLTGMHHLLLAAGNVPCQTLLLNFETLLAEVETSLLQCIHFLGLEAETELILGAWPDISTGYSKQPELPYSAFNRRQTLQRGRANRSDDIALGMAWAKSLTATIDTPAGTEPLELFFS